MSSAISIPAAQDALRRIGIHSPVTLPKLAHALYKRSWGWEIQGLGGVTWVAVVARAPEDGELYAIGHVELEGYNLVPSLSQAFALALEWQAAQK